MYETTEQIEYKYRMTVKDIKAEIKDMNEYADELFADAEWDSEDFQAMRTFVENIITKANIIRNMFSGE